MNDKIKHEIITWGIFILGVLILVYPFGKLVMALHIPYWLVSIVSVLTGMVWMLIVEWFTTKILKK
jgi:hypothetical protein